MIQMKKMRKKVQMKKKKANIYLKFVFILNYFLFKKIKLKHIK